MKRNYKEFIPYLLGYITGILIQVFCLILIFDGLFNNEIVRVFAGFCFYQLYFLLTIKLEIKDIKKKLGMIDDEKKI